MNAEVQRLLQKAQAAYKRGDRAAARRLAKEMVQRDPNCEQGWLLLAALAAPRASIAYLQRALAINPQSEQARRGLEWAQKRLARARSLQALRSEPTASVARGRSAAPRARKGKKRRRMWPLLVALLALLATAWSATFGAASSILAAQPTPTAQVWATVALTRTTPTASSTPTALPSATPSPTPTATATPTPLSTFLPPPLAVTATPTPVPCQFAAELVDETIPDGQAMTPGEVFTKTWDLKNAGNCSWQPNFALVFERGNRMSGATTIRLGREVLPGEIITLAVELEAPRQSGEYTGYWRLQTADGETFGLAGGESFWVRVQVGVPVEVPAAIEGSERWIDVDLSEQRLYAYEGERLVNSFVVSTGTWQYPTVTGQYRIYVKYRYTDMAGPGYYLPNVPYTMYFYRGYGIHGTYWHNNFGTPMSHGCINMRTEEAGWLFNWASVGTLVNIHP